MKIHKIVTNEVVSDVAEAATPLLSDLLYHGLCTWLASPSRLHIYREQVEPLVIEMLDSDPNESQQNILEVILHTYRMAYFDQESQYAYLDTESVSVDEQRLRDIMDCPVPEEAILASDKIEYDNPICALYHRYGASHTRKLLGMDHAQTVSPEYLECCYQQQYHRAKAFEAYTGFLRSATEVKAAHSEIVWLLLEQLSQ